jgi:hypothetical protein
MQDSPEPKEQVIEILRSMEQLFKLANIGEQYYRLPATEVKPELWIDALLWLHSEAQEAYLAWRKIRKHQSEERWEWYARDPKMFRNFRETVLHEEALRAARRLWISVKRPQLFRIRLRKD